MEFLYVCHFSNGHIKVGRSVDPAGRIAVHADRVACVGIELIDRHIVECQHGAVYPELLLIERCAANAIGRNKSEWFVGLDFQEVCAWAGEVSSAKQEPKPAKPVAIVNADRPLHERRYRYVWDWETCTGHWLDSTPEEPHWPESAVMRWDLRPTDWHKLWPELVSHPCAIHFAKFHPDRPGPKSFADWVKSWPTAFDPSEMIATMPEKAKQIVLSVRSIAPEVPTPQGA